MRILINGSNLNGGGGAQVADSICQTLGSYCQHYFIVVLPSRMQSTIAKLDAFFNVRIYIYDYPCRDWKSFITGRNRYLDNLVEQEHVEMVFTFFAPCKWKPKVPHLAGFALAHLVVPESPYFQRMSIIQQIKWAIKIRLWKHIFNRTDFFYTENPLITRRLQNIFPNKSVYTVTNFYNQVFDHPENQIFHQLPLYNGWQILNVGSSAPHKNLIISIEIARLLQSYYQQDILNSEKPDFRFIFTINKAEFPNIPLELREHFLFLGKVEISEVPSLYEQSDFLFQPTLLECFTAVYPEAMRMGRPIITSNLEFARGLCGNAALYYDATNPASAADRIVELIKSPSLRQQLVNNGQEELKKFDDYETRSKKIISLCEKIASGNV